jgi:hypothetical protein
MPPAAFEPEALSRVFTAPLGARVAPGYYAGDTIGDSGAPTDAITPRLTRPTELLIVA